MKIQIEINRPRWTQNWSRRRKLVAALTLAFVLLPTAYVIGSDSFSDVPNSYPFHDAINAIYGARITTGCAPGQYCPDAPVTRGQMAAFMQRGFGRTAYVAGQDTNLTENPLISVYDLAVLTSNTGGASGGRGFLKVDAAFTAHTFATAGCPCRVEVYLRSDDGAQSIPYYVTLPNRVSGVLETSSGAVTLSFPFFTSNTATLRLKARLFESAGVPNFNIIAYGAITALYVPFGSTGGNSLSASEAESPGSSASSTHP
jgi:hypothetical protein